MDIPFTVRSTEAQGEILLSDVVGCLKQELKNGTLPVEPETRCTRTGCEFTVRQGLFGDVSDNNASCASEQLRRELLAGTFTPPSLEV